MRSSDTSGSTAFDRRWIAVFALLLSMTGCGGGGGGGGGDGGSGGGGGGASGGNSGPPDFISPTVTAITPIDDTTGFPTNDSITATFSEAVTPTDVDTNSFRLTDGVIPIPGTVSYDATNHVAVFTPIGGFAPNTRYTATVVTGIRDIRGNPFMTDFAWCFETGGSTDLTAPGVAFTIPANAATNVAINRNVTATFNEHMNSTTLTPASFTLTGPGGAAVSGAVYYRGGTAIFSPAQNLAANTVYAAKIGAGVADMAGNAAQANVAWSFTTGADADATDPAVSSTSPANAATAVAIGTAFRVSFNEPMDPVSITTENFMVTAAAGVIGTVAYDSSNNTATFTRINHLTSPVTSHLTPVSDLDPNTTYTATLTTGVTDLAGNAPASNVVWSITTAP